VELVYSVNVFGALKQRTHLCYAVNKTKLENQVHFHVGEWLNISVPAVQSSHVRYAENIRITKLHIVFNLLLPWHRRFVVGLLPRRPGFSCSIIVGFMVDEEALGQVCQGTLKLSLPFIPVMLHIRLSWGRTLFPAPLLKLSTQTAVENSVPRALTIKISAFCPQSLYFVWFHSMGIVVLTQNVIDQLVHVIETDRVHCQVTPEFLNVLWMRFRLHRFNLKTCLTIHSTFKRPRIFVFVKSRRSSGW